jgi:hypothetical protein
MATLHTYSVRMMVVTLATAFLIAPLAPRADASHHPRNYCSETGDVCQSTAEVDGVRKLRITLAAKYFDRYRLCVVAPDDSRTCKTFDIEPQGTSFYGDSVRWSAQFPDAGPGPYTVIWKMTSGDRIGHRLGFHV